MNPSTKQNGFIALILVVMVSSLLMSVLVPSAASSVIHRLTIATTEEKVQARYLAEACMYEALVLVAYNKFYKGNEILYNGELSCSIEPIPPPSVGQLEIQTSSKVNNKTIKAKTIIDAYTLSIISWQEE